MGGIHGRCMGALWVKPFSQSDTLYSVLLCTLMSTYPASKS